MPVLVRDPMPPDMDALLARRRSNRQDRFDEVWDGVYHMNPSPSFGHASLNQQLSVLLDRLARAAGLIPAITQVNIGHGVDNYRVPDGAIFREVPPAPLWLPTAALVLEILSPHDEAWEKLDHYAEHGVEETIIVDPQERRVHWLALSRDAEPAPLERSRLIDLSAGELSARLDWPPQP